jgi:group I intron endonuclease
LKLIIIICFTIFIYQIYYDSFQYDNFFSIFYIQFLNIIPIKPLKTYNDLFNINLFKKDLGNLGGVYSLIHVNSSKQYIGSSLNLYSRIMDHIKGRDSNIRLQRAIKKYGLTSFNVIIYYFHTDPAVLLTNIETTVISSFPFSSLFNFKKEANSMIGYKHTKQAIEKMKSRFVDKINHPMFGKTHNKFTLSLISKPGVLNPMFGKTHKEHTKNLISIKKSIRPLGLYDENYNLIEKYSNQVVLANKFSVNKTTISRYIKSGKLFKGKFFIREINNKINKIQ